MSKNTIIIHSGEDNQTGFIRLFFPTFIANSKFYNGGLKVEQHWHPIQDGELLKDVQSIVIQRPISERDAQLVRFYAGYRNTYKYNIVFEWDDILWDCYPEQMKTVQSIADIPNFVVCSTRRLAKEWKKISSRPTVVLPNGVAAYSCADIHQPTLEHIEKPVVLYGGSLGHENDFWDNWKDALNSMIEKNEIEFHSFVKPNFIQNSSKITLHDFTTPVEWMNTISKIHPDIYIAPLENSLFNKCKSDLKVKEAGAMGCVFLGSDFADSPYSYVPKDMLVKENDDVCLKILNLCKPLVYNENRQWLRDAYINKHWNITDNQFMLKWFEAYSNGREV